MLEIDLCGQLDFARDSLKRRGRASRADGSKAVSDCGIWVIELQSVEQIEELGAQLQ